MPACNVHHTTKGDIQECVSPTSSRLSNVVISAVLIGILITLLGAQKVFLDEALPGAIREKINDSSDTMCFKLDKTDHLIFRKHTLFVSLQVALKSPP